MPRIDSFETRNERIVSSFESDLLGGFGGFRGLGFNMSWLQ